MRIDSQIRLDQNGLDWIRLDLDLDQIRLYRLDYIDQIRLDQIRLDQIRLGQIRLDLDQTRLDQIR